LSPSETGSDWDCSPAILSVESISLGWLGNWWRSIGMGKSAKETGKFYFVPDWKKRSACSDRLRIEFERSIHWWIAPGIFSPHASLSPVVVASPRPTVNSFFTDSQTSSGFLSNGARRAESPNHQKIKKKPH